MNQKDYERISLIMREVVNNFSLKDTCDECFVVRSSLEILKNLDSYEKTAENFPYLDISFVFFFRFLFGDTEQVRKCLSSAERTYKREVDRGVIQSDQLREMIFKTTLASLKTGNDFSWLYSNLILRPFIDLRMQLKKEFDSTPSINVCLTVVLKNLVVSAGPQDLFCSLVQR